MREALIVGGLGLMMILFIAITEEMANFLDDTRGPD